MNIKINDDIKNKLGDFTVAALTFTVSVNVNEQLNQLIDKLEVDIANKYELADVLTIPNIKDARDGYKVLGKDPSRYRLACESLLRRLVKGNKLYRINNVVDVGNVLSIETSRSIAVLDADKIVGDVEIRVGKDEMYEGIGRGQINIENIPVYCDQIGPFGSPTSDTMRTMITDETKNVLVFIISFNGKNYLDNDIELCQNLYNEYCNANNFNIDIIE